MSRRTRADVCDRSRKFVAVPYNVIDSINDGEALGLYIVLKRYATGGSGVCPSNETLAKLLGYTSYEPLFQAFDKLKALGLVRTSPQHLEVDNAADQND